MPTSVLAVPSAVGIAEQILIVHNR